MSCGVFVCQKFFYMLVQCSSTANVPPFELDSAAIPRISLTNLKFSVAFLFHSANSGPRIIILILYDFPQLPSILTRKILITHNLTTVHFIVRRVENEFLVPAPSSSASETNKYKRSSLFTNLLSKEYKQVRYRQNLKLPFVIFILSIPQIPSISLFVKLYFVLKLFLCKHLYPPNFLRLNLPL